MKYYYDLSMKHANAHARQLRLAAAAGLVVLLVSAIALVGRTHSSQLVPPPKKVAAAATDPHTVKLRWEPVQTTAKIAGYRLYRNGMPVTTVGSNTVEYTESSLQPESHYSYTVRTVAAAGATSEPANTVDVTTPPVPVSLNFYANPGNDAVQYAAAHPDDEAARLIDRMGHTPVASWFAGNAAQDTVATLVQAAAAAKQVPVVVLYNIPGRDCGGFSAGGAQTEAAYDSWVRSMAAGIGNSPAWVILEPDAIPMTDCLNADQQAARWRELANAVAVLTTHPQVKVYIDAGDPSWRSADEIASRLRLAGVAQAAGFALNTSNYNTTADIETYGEKISAQLANKHFVIDTSRNGNGPDDKRQWCNPAGRALGAAPSTLTDNQLVDAYLWIKIPWDSDGYCNGGPAAGQPFWAYAAQLAKNAGWQ